MAAAQFVVQNVLVDEVFVDGDRRALNEAAVASLVESIKSIGLQTPITVRGDDTIADPDTGEVIGGYALVAGRHRLEACRALGYERIPAVVRECDEIDAELWEIAENLHRAELTVLERDTQVARWISLNLDSDRKKSLSQVATNSSGGRPTTVGVRAAERELGIKRDDASRAVKVAKLSEEARRVAREVGLDDNRTALLAAAAKNTPEEQAEALRQRAARPAKIIDIPEPKDWSEVEADQKRRLMQVWNGCSPAVQQWFTETIIDRPVMDRRYG
jgi:ParB/RepB/Spo0J family partition protein